MKKTGLFFLLAVLAVGATLFLIVDLSESEQQHSGDNCRGCHGNRFTQRVVITDTTVPATLEMGEDATMEITVMDDCRNQGNVHTGTYSELDEGTNLWLDSENGLVTDNRNGDPAVIPHIESQEEKSASWAITGGYDFGVEELLAEGERTVGEEITFTATITNSGAGDDELTIHIEGHNSHENEIQITDDSYDITVENATLNATVTFRLDGEIINTTKVALGHNEETTLEVTWTAEYGGHDISVEVEGEPDGETDTGNNNLMEEFTIAGKPELFVDQIELLSEDPVVGQLVELRALVRNSGDENTETAYIFKLGDDELKNGTVPVDSGDSAILTVTWNSTGHDAGDHIITLILDEEDMVAEYDETNNTGSLQVTLLPPPEKPDAVAISIGTEPEMILEGEEFHILAQLQNTGGAWVNITATVLVDDEEVHTTPLMLAPLESRELNVSTTLAAGEHDLILELTDADVEEESLANNLETGQVSIMPLPVVFVQGVYLPDIEEIFEDELLAVTGKVVNSGDLDVKLRYSFLVDNVSMEAGTVTIEASTILTLPFNWTTEGVGAHTISLKIEGQSPANITTGESSVSLEVLAEVIPEPPELIIKTLLIAPASPTEGDTVYITVSAGFGETIDITVEVFLDGVLLRMKRVELSGEKTILFQWENATAGEHELTAKISHVDGTLPVEKTLKFTVEEKTSDGESGEEAGFLALDLELCVAALLIALFMKHRKKAAIEIA